MGLTYVVTGGAGFIGSNLVHQLLDRVTTSRVVVYDRLTYAGNLDNLADIADDGRYHFVRGDICDRQEVRQLLFDVKPDVVFNLAAESHVDRSIDGPGEFVRTNVTGTFELLDGARALLMREGDDFRRRFRFVHISTDEVFGSLGAEGLFRETTPYAPSSPYAASKAGADHLVHAYFLTYGMPAITTNCSNNYGSYQFPEKLIPLTILNALEEKPLPIYGDGKNVRDWLYVGDHAEALMLAAERGLPGQTYNVGGHNERSNIDVAHTICDTLDRLVPRKKGGSYRDLVTFVKDRPGHDRRYAIDATKIEHELGWKPRTSFAEGLDMTIRWYLAHRSWCDRITQGVYRRERLGLAEGAK